MSTTPTYNYLEDFWIKVAQGEIQGYSLIDKFGENPTVTTGTDPADIWEGGIIAGAEIYTFSTTADIDTLSSSSTEDVGNLIKITGLLSGGIEQIGWAELNGWNKVLIYDNQDLTGDPISYWRIIRIENESDVGGDLVGFVYCYVDGDITEGVPDVVTTIRALINNGNNQTLMSVYTVPKGKVGFLMRGEVGISKSGGVSAEARLSYRSRRFGKVFKIKKKISLSTNGTSAFQDKRSRPDPIPALTDIVIRCDEVSATLGLWATLDIALVDEAYLSTEYLTAIGQPE